MRAYILVIDADSEASHELVGCFLQHLLRLSVAPGRKVDLHLIGGRKERE